MKEFSPTIGLLGKLSLLWSYRGFLLLLGSIVLLLIVLVKAKSGSEFFSDPLLFGYTIFVTTFELSRIFAAAIYHQSYEYIVPQANESYEPTVSFVIPCKNEEKAIRTTILKCFAADYPKDKLEVIVINDGSTDATPWILSKLQGRLDRLTVVHWEKNRGKRHAMAEGFRRARGEIIIQLDSDSYVDPRTFRNLIAPFRNPRVGGVSAHTDPENAEENLITKMQAAYYFVSFRILKAAESSFLHVFCCSGCASAYRKSVIAPIIDAWLGERFLGLPVTWGDDRGLTNWVLRQNYHTMYSDKVKAYTVVPNTLKKFLKQQVRWKKGWFVNSIFASKFIIKKEPFVAFTYFFPLMMVTVLTPIMAVRAFIYNPFFNGVVPFFYIMGVFLIAALITIYYRWLSWDNKYWKYVFLWSILNMILLSFVLFYSLATLQNRKWGTRE